MLADRRETEARERAERELRIDGVAIVGERTWEERDAELRARAVNLCDED